MIGTLINTGTVVLGGSLGTLLGGRLPEKMRTIVTIALGLVTLVIGIQMSLKTANILIMLASAILGGIVGELISIDERLKALAEVFSRLVEGEGEGDATARANFSRGLVTASLVFCIGPLTILGSFQDGLTGDFSLLAIKSMLDGFAALAFASALGVGVIFSAAVVLVYQGALTLSAAWVRPLLTDAMITEMTAVGGLLILGIGLTMLDIKRLPVPNLLPAIFIAPLLVLVTKAVFG
ncbi:MAG: DUF554 domain-containing protein [Dehalococcoidia bacterium]|nr:DUF554 domain-containing protein [Dehalococcoidia bacterium]